MTRRFSESIGLRKPRDVVQKGAIDKRLKNRLWSVCIRLFFNNCSKFLSQTEFTQEFYIALWDSFYGKSIDGLNDYAQDNQHFVKEWFEYAKWNEVYDLLQFFADFSKISGSSGANSTLRSFGEIFMTWCNEVLEEEKSAYRFVAGELVELTDDLEIEEIEAAVASEGFGGSSSHLRAALRYYADRDAPDYRNSIKESISAIESVLNWMADEKSSSLGSALKKVEERGVQFHPALKKGILNIYGWTSDEAGVRHALLEEESNVTEADAKFMLIACSALKNYVLAKHG